MGKNDRMIYDYIGLKTPKGTADLWRTAASRSGQSVSKWIINAVHIAYGVGTADSVADKVTVPAGSVVKCLGCGATWAMSSGDVVCPQCGEFRKLRTVKGV